ncbi:small serum protein 2-like [Myxocyprinus asiaticus]|uniref:small serum protein 2-like n=1 Tax=Myxocyprinus asiaticus TaxID=70543 RepID=UPI00222268C3|nr:small serum protein 2-like [Myxocyprinus asiaticus]
MSAVTPLFLLLFKTPHVVFVAFSQTSIFTTLSKMGFLALGLVFCALVSLSDSYCFITAPALGAEHCVDDDDKSLHSPGTTWTNSRCIRCTCFDSKEMRCCDSMGRANIETEGCIVKYDFSTCTFKVFHEKDSTIRCEYGVVGK